jgi:hypothetical protein
MLLTLINDNASVLNLSRVQPYLEGIDAEIDNDEEGGGDSGSDAGFDEVDAGQAGPSGEQEKRTGVRFEDSGAATMTATTTTTAPNRDAAPWYPDSIQTTPGGMRLADIMHTSNPSITDKSPFGTSHPADRPTTSAAAQQLLDFGNGYATHPWNGGDDPSSRNGEEFSSHAKTRRHVSSERRTRDGSEDGRDGEGSRPPISRAPSLTEHHAALALEVRPLFPFFARR